MLICISGPFSQRHFSKFLKLKASFKVIKRKGKHENKIAETWYICMLVNVYFWLNVKCLKSKQVSYFSVSYRCVKDDCWQTLEGTP